MLILVGRIPSKFPSNSQAQQLGQASIKNTVQQFANQLPKDPNHLIKQGWQDVTHSEKAKLGQKTFQHPTEKLRVEFHPGESGKGGWGRKDHYHIHNPNRTSKRDHYLDIQGNPVAKGLDASHIDPSPSASASTRFNNLEELKQNTIPTSSKTLPSQSLSSANTSPSPHR
jgi:hypothetical protein